MTTKLKTSVAFSLATVFAASALLATTAEARNGTNRGGAKSRDGMMRLGAPNQNNRSTAANLAGCKFCTGDQVRDFYLERDRIGNGSGAGR